jgi:hypothetical protein
MATLEPIKPTRFEKLKVPFNKDFKSLDYGYEPFNDPDSIYFWKSTGYHDRFVGAMCDMRKEQPAWAQDIRDYFTNELNWKDIGTSFYRMSTGTVLPMHSDLYKRYIEIFELEGKEETVCRALVMLEDWQSGHILELGGKAIIDYKAGDMAMWRNSEPHMAANIGLTDRYTLQITGQCSIEDWNNAFE